MRTLKGAWAMTAWIVRIGADYPQHLDFAFRDGLWDFNQRRDIQPGDDLFFWQLGAKELGGWATASTAMEPRTTAMPAASWKDDSPTRYKYRVGIEPRSAEPSTSPEWSEIQRRIGTGGSPSPVIEVRTSEGEAYLKGLFGTAPSSIETKVKAQLAARGQFLDATDRRLRRVADVVYRPRQGKFRDGLLVAYGGRCAVTDSDVAESLEAAHIVAYKGMESDAIQNGVLLRVDLHRLFDRFLLTIGADQCVHLHPRLRKGVYEALAGESVRMPADPAHAPDPEALATHWKACEYMTAQGYARM